MCVYICVYACICSPIGAVCAPPRRCTPTCACVRWTPFYICIYELFIYYLDIIYMCVYIYVYMHVCVVQLVHFVHLHVNARRRAHARVGHLSICKYTSCLHIIWILYICTYIYVYVYAYICSAIGAVHAPPRRCPPACACTRRTPFYTYMYESFIWYLDIIYICAHVYTYICIYMYIHVYICIYTYT